MNTGSPAAALRRRSPSIIYWLGLLVVLVALPIGLAASLLLAEQRQVAQLLIRDALMATAQHLTVSVDRELAGNRAILQTLADSDFVTERNWRALHAYAQRTIEHRPRTLIALTAPDGQLVFNTALPYGAPLPNLRALEADRRTAEWEGRTLPLGSQELTRLVFETGNPQNSNLYFGVSIERPTVALSVPVVRNGRIVGALTISFPPESLEEVLRGTTGGDVRLSVFDRNGVVIATNGAGARRIGDRVGDALWSAFRQEGSGFMQGTASDAPDRLVAYSRIKTSGWGVRAALDKKLAYEPLQQSFLVWVAVCALALLVTLLVGFLLSRRLALPLRALARAAPTIQQGEAPNVPDTGLFEIDTLRDTLVEAARAENRRRGEELKRKVAEEKAGASAESEKWIRLLLDNLFVFVGVLEPDGTLVDANLAPIRAAGLRREDVIGLPFWECYWWSYDTDVQERLKKAVAKAAKGETVRFDVPVRVAGGNTITIDFQLAPVMRNGAVFRLIPSAVDVTKRVEIERELREMNARRADFLAMLSHELRNPLAPMRTALALLMHEGTSQEIERKAKEILNRQTEHLARLVNDLLELTRFTRGKIELVKDTVDLCELVTQVCDDYAAAADGHALSLSFECRDAPLWVFADAARIVQVAKNLLENAVKFTPPGGQIRVTVARSAGEAVLCVADTGQGISAEFLPHLFEAFVQGDRSVGGRLGLGLALVKQIAEQHGGQVKGESAGIGTGAQFTVRLPLSSPPRAAIAPVSVQGEAERKRIMVVDDNVDAAESLAMLLRLAGHVVETAHSGEACLAVVEQKAPDVVVCDIDMPVMDGYQVARALKRKRATLPLIALSGYAQAEDVQRALDAGFERHAAKPVDPVVITALVADVTCQQHQGED